MQQLARENRSLAERIGQWIKDFVRRLKRAFKGVEARHEEARILMRHAEDMQKMWDRALVQAVYNRDAQDSKKAATEGGGVKYSVHETIDGYTYTMIDATEIKAEGISGSENIGKKARIYMRQHFRGVVLPLGKTKGAYIRSDGINEYTNPAKYLSEEDYSSKMLAATELDNMLQASTFLRWAKDNGHHKEATRGWNYYQTVFAVNIGGSIRVYQGEVQIMRITRGDVFHDITKIKDITNSNMGQSISANAQSAGNAYGNISAPDDSISDSAGSVNTKYSQWDEGVSDRELLLDAATEENASEAVLAYARKYKAYEGLLRREERLRARLEASRAAEQKQTGPADNGATEIEEKLRKCREEIARAEMRLAKLEAGAELRREADKAREKWWNRNMAEAVRSNRQIREENTELKSYVEAYRRQMERTKPGEERVRTEDVNRLARALLKEHGSGLDSSYLARRLQKLGDYIVSNNGGEGISYQKLRQEARSLAKEIAENCTVEIDDNRELRKEIRDYLKDTRLQISDELRGDIADFEDFRRSNFGTLRMAKDGRSCSGDENNETHAKIKNGGIKNERTR